MTTEETLTALGRLVRRRRERLGLSIDQAAEEGGMSPVTWSRVELGRKVRRLTYAPVDRVLGWVEGACVDFLDEGIEPGEARTGGAAIGGRLEVRADGYATHNPPEEDEFARLDRLVREWQEARSPEDERDRARARVLEELLESWKNRDAG